MPALYESNGICIEECIDGCAYIVRGYKSGCNYPDPYVWVFFVVVKDGIGEVKGFLSQIGTKLRLSHSRIIHRYFDGLGIDIRNYSRSTGGSLRKVAGLCRKQNLSL